MFTFRMSYLNKVLVTDTVSLNPILERDKTVFSAMPFLRPYLRSIGLQGYNATKSKILHLNLAERVLLIYSLLCIGEMLRRLGRNPLFPKENNLKK